MDIFDVTFAVQSDPFIVSSDGTISSDITVQILSGSGEAESSLLPGGSQSAELAGTEVETSIEG